MQTKLNILASAILGVSGLCVLVSHNASALVFFVLGILLYLAAYLANDRKDKQIEEIHQIITTPLKPENIEESEPTKSVYDERAERGEPILRSL